MAKRMILVLTLLAAIIAGLGAVKYMQIQAAVAKGAAFRPPPEAVTTLVAREVQWQETLDVIGTATAVRGVTVSADLPGIVSQITFDSGRAVREGEVLVQLDTRQEHAQLAAVEAQRDLARLNLDRMERLLADGITPRSEYDRVAAESKEAVARVGEIHATIERKTIRAPFTGVLGIRQVSLGQYLPGGAPVVPLQSLDPIYVDFGVPQQEVEHIRAGTEVTVTAEGIEGVAASGRVTAVDAVVDPATRNVHVQATFANADGRLHPGMFVQVHVVLGAGDKVIALPASAINYAPYGDSVFIVEDLKGPDGASYRGVRQQVVKLGAGRGDQVAVLSGVPAGAEVVTTGVFKLRNGAAVLVDNSVLPGNDPAPKPEES
jgi:membrane fusion protein (multidrug efflux system)